MKLNKFEIKILDGLVWSVLSRYITKSRINHAYRSTYGYWKHKYKIASIFINDPDKFQEWINNNPPGDSVYICVGKIGKKEKEK